MVMIPGAWEPRPRAATVPEPAALAPPRLVERRDEQASPATQRVALPGWMKVSLFAGTLLAATWIAMAMFF